MSMKLTAEFIAAELKRTTAAQASAADPTASVWVSANAGTGKTHVLTMRVLRLMLAGTPPERILCLTYTKAAAAEMSKRVFDSLAKWVMVPEEALAKTLAKDYLGRAPTADEMNLARTLFTRATETPGGLRVQTIHAFSERLLQRFPLEAGVTPGFAILDDDTARTLRREAIDQVLSRAVRTKGSPLARALDATIAYAAGDQFDSILTDALSHRDWIDVAARLPSEHEGGDEGLALARKHYEAHFDVPHGTTRDDLLSRMVASISEADLRRAESILASGSANDQKLGACVRAALKATSPVQRVSGLEDLFHKSDGDPREKFLTKALAAEHPDVTPMLERARDKFVPLFSLYQRFKVVDATMALLELASAVLDLYTDAKQRRAALDFDDLIDRTRRLLLTPGNAEWVLFKLDNGLDHILVDESQDTSPQQWQVIEALAAEFFSGTGARSDVPRTVFAVGDEKQSIYSFQGAAPKMFADTGRRFEARANEAQVPFRPVPLNVSFRTVEPVLEAVDVVFSSEARTPGVKGNVRHIARRFGHAGLVEIWPLEEPQKVDPADAWSPLEDSSPELPVVRLANRIADTIKHWLETREQLPSIGRAIEPGDVIILVRKRHPMAAPMVQALKARGIPVAGADRMALSDQIVVQDLLSLGDFLTLPEDDLALAEVLKSPMFGFTDDDLLSIAYERPRTLWKALLEAAPRGAPFTEAADTLKLWRKAADFRPPYEFFADLLDRDGMRTRLIARLGPDATDPLDEFLNLALTYDDSAPPSLSGFLAFMREGTREIKRDMEHGRNQVRVMTVHGAKGLEAPIVIMPDTTSLDSAGGGAARPIKLPTMPRPMGAPDPFVWPVKGSGNVTALGDAKAELSARDREEYQRLLYVAMTRPRDRLYVAGFERGKAASPDCWYHLIRGSLADRLVPATSHDGRDVLRLATEQTVEPEAPRAALTGHTEGVARPEWAAARAPREPQLTIPLAPSRLAPYDTDDEGDPSPMPRVADPAAEAPEPSPRAMTAESRFLRGTLTHSLLELLPEVSPRSWSKTATAFLSERAKELPAKARKSIADEVLAILRDERFGPVFSAASRAEVPIVAELPRPAGARSGPPLRITGQIDRLAELEAEVLIVDFKTNRRAPARVEDVAPAYLYQIAAYRLAVREIYAGKPVEAALLWTDGAQLMRIPGEILDHYAAGLWSLAAPRLDDPGAPS